MTTTYDRVPTNDSDLNRGIDFNSPLTLSRPNEKYGATATATATAAANAAMSGARPVKTCSDFAIIYLSALLSDMTRGILFPTVFHVNYLPEKVHFTLCSAMSYLFHVGFIY